MVTAHDFITSRMTEKAEVDITLIGDSLANTTLGYSSTTSLPFDEFLYHTKSVERGNSTSLLIADLPFGSFESSHEQAILSATKIVKEAKVQGIKLEGASPYILELITKLIDFGIPVIGHVGLTPQKHNSIGFKLQGTDSSEAVRIFEDCKKLADAGVFAIVLECIPNKIAEHITNNINVPTIGIGAGPYCSGQVLVISDMLGMIENDSPPKFVKTYANFFETGVNAIKEYNQDLENGSFPDANTHGYKVKLEVLKKFKESV